MARIFLLFVALSASAQVAITPSFKSSGPVTITVSPGSPGKIAITGWPYSGDRTRETILADNTHLSQSLAREFRDSKGRMRIEHSGQGYGSLTIVEIQDPVAGFDWVLDPTAQVAYRMPLQVKLWGGAPKLTPCNPGSGPVTGQTTNSGMVTTNEQLGSKKIEGIEACGHRTAMTRQDGSPRTGAEIWTSRENIGGILLNKLDDARGGRNVMQLVNIKFSEPEAGLFLPPVGYKVTPQTSPFTITDSSRAQTSQEPPAPLKRKFVALTGMPWSGESISGGTVISRQFRDSMGRTRREPVAVSGTVTVFDPVAGFSWTLDSQRRTARRQSITVESKPASEASTTPPDEHVRDLLYGVKGRTESLGTKTIDGVLTVGTRTTLTYPPGSISGNTTTTSSVTETWASPQLGASLLLHSFGAVAPTSTITLLILNYTEPDPGLFKVPEDYTVIDEQ